MDATAFGARPCIRAGAGAAAGAHVRSRCSYSGRECEKCANTPMSDGAGEWVLMIEGQLGSCHWRPVVGPSARRSDSVFDVFVSRIPQVGRSLGPDAAVP